MVCTSTWIGMSTPSTSALERLSTIASPRLITLTLNAADGRYYGVGVDAAYNWRLYAFDSSTNIFTPGNQSHLYYDNVFGMNRSIIYV